MITLTATIDILKSGTGADEKGTLSSLACNFSGNNISKSLISTGIKPIIGVKKRIKTPFTLGKSKLGTGRKFCAYLNYFKGEILSDDNGDFPSDYIVTVKGSNITAITLAFDDLNMQFPKSIMLNGNQYTDDDPIWTIANIPSTNELTINIANWNTPNEPLILSGIYINVSINLDNKNLAGIDFSTMTRSDNAQPSWGIISNQGTIRFNDINGEVWDYAGQLLLQSGLDVKISLNNTLKGKSQIVGMYNTFAWDYDKYSRVVSVTIKDDLEEWQNIQIEEFYCIGNDKTMLDVHNYLKSKTPARYKFATIPDDVSDREDIEGALSAIKIPYIHLSQGSLWSGWNKLCSVAMLKIYMNSDNEIVIKRGV